ncbi:hypothetical protein M3697_02600 [Janibacter melonis]|uniref:hypothetical protein n=1 Tax=Janibacter melonis TaxID=262209 RepID=UPI002044C6CF|nr:hypothetical protein [Janibacter melonis]MCM3554005.1 hypothetical protein [Janibacter melonis]
MTDTTTTETTAETEDPRAHETRSGTDEGETHEPTSPDAAQQDEQTPGDEPETFPRSVVEKLRKENATYRERAKKADQYARELHAARVASTGRLADPSDLDFDPAHLDDLSVLEAAIDDLLDRKPHLANRRPRGSVGQGMGGSTTSTDLAGMLRSRA